MSENRFCTKCGMKLEDGAIFCTKCGQKVDEVQESFQQPVHNQVSPQGQAVTNQAVPQGQQVYGQSVNSQVPLQGQPMNNQAPQQQGQPMYSQVPPQGQPMNNQAPQQGQPMYNQVPPQGQQVNNQAPQQGQPMNSQAPQQGQPMYGQVPPQGQSMNSQASQQGQPMYNQVPPQRPPMNSQIPQQSQPMYNQMPPQGQPGYSNMPSEIKGKSSNKKGILAVVGVVALFAIGFFVWKTFFSYPSSPEGVAKAFISSIMEDKDAKKAASYVSDDVEVSGADISDLQDICDEMDSYDIDIKNIKATDVEKDGNYAEVEIEIAVEFMGEKDTQTADISLQKEDGKWKVVDYYE
ncbi:MAG TPA: zinc-ribbon domain-containing protein [Lachnospiraceae bacterium]|nr:zinc-ribbon domain-containing protein [Lachnospiraceae bacterium]